MQSLAGKFGHTGITLRAGATFNRPFSQRLKHLFRFAAEDKRGFDPGDQVRVDQLVKNVSAVTAGFYQSRPAQQHQVLGYHRLPQTEHGFKMTHTGLLRGHDRQQLQPNRLSDKRKKTGRFWSPI